MFEFAWWWALFALPLPLIVRLLSPKTQQTDVALRVPNLMNNLPQSSS
ncbi:MAG: IMP dehydrogenase, partial [Aestuariibacter sp.]|nr:IMP dehydrogenase [Aestuariibacter sp.]MCP5011765.1 IMP dehydrogenase [Aestuariibacter sp.]